MTSSYETSNFHDSDIGKQPDALAAPEGLSSGSDYGSETEFKMERKTSREIEDGGALRSARGSRRSVVASPGRII
jgi:hypothetical protein